MSQPKKKVKMKDGRLRAFELDCKYPNTPRSVILSILEKEGYDIAQFPKIRFLNVRRRCSSTGEFEKLLRKRIREMNGS